MEKSGKQSKVMIDNGGANIEINAFFGKMFEIID